VLLRSRGAARCSGAEVQIWIMEMPRCSGTEVQRCRGADMEMLNCRDAEMQRQRCRYA